jgi:hypothetical protein
MYTDNFMDDFITLQRFLDKNLLTGLIHTCCVYRCIYRTQLLFKVGGVFTARVTSHAVSVHIAMYTDKNRIILVTKFLTVYTGPFYTYFYQRNTLLMYTKTWCSVTRATSKKFYFYTKPTNQNAFIGLRGKSCVALTGYMNILGYLKLQDGYMNFYTQRVSQSNFSVFIWSIITNNVYG